MNEATETTDHVISQVTSQVTWMVTARNGHYERRTPGPSVWMPYGLQHARQVGSGTTACGLGAVEWEIFWEHRFPTERGSSCPDCRRVLQLAAHGVAKFANHR